MVHFWQRTNQMQHIFIRLEGEVDKPCLYYTCKRSVCPSIFDQWEQSVYSASDDWCLGDLGPRTEVSSSTFGRHKHIAKVREREREKWDSNKPCKGQIEKTPNNRMDQHQSVNINEGIWLWHDIFPLPNTHYFYTEQCYTASFSYTGQLHNYTVEPGAI